MEMSRKRFTPEQIIGKLWEAEVALADRYLQIFRLKSGFISPEKGRL